MNALNSKEVAAKWVSFVASHPRFPAGERLGESFAAGSITHLCGCGCNSFNFEVQHGTAVRPLAKPGGGSGCVFQLEFEISDPDSSEQRSLEFLLFADHRGHFDGMDVSFCGNAYAVPATLKIIEPPYLAHNLAIEI